MDVTDAVTEPVVLYVGVTLAVPDGDPVSEGVLVGVTVSGPVTEAVPVDVTEAPGEDVTAAQTSIQINA